MTTSTTPKKKHGGYRANAGRPKASKDQITIHGLLNEIGLRAAGRSYEQLLVEDFLLARSRQDHQMVVKYHHLILNKVMNTLTRVEIEDSVDVLEAKKLAFSQALAQLVATTNT